MGLPIGGIPDEGAYVLPENRMRGEIPDLYVAPEARRTGLALALLGEAERRFEGLGVRRVEIGALAANPAARALYGRWAGRPHAVLCALAAGARRFIKAVALGAGARQCRRARRRWGRTLLGTGMGMTADLRQAGAAEAPVLRVRDLGVSFGEGRFSAQVVEGVSFSLRRGETLAIVGRVGSGKTVSGKAILGILPKGARATSGTAIFRGRDGAEADLLALSPRKLRAVRGGRISMIFQEPMSSLSPLHTIGAQTEEVVRLHSPLRGRAAKARCLEVFDAGGLPGPGAGVERLSVRAFGRAAAARDDRHGAWSASPTW